LQGWFEEFSETIPYINTDIPVLKWRYQTTDESQIPLNGKFIFFFQLASDIVMY